MTKPLRIVIFQESQPDNTLVQKTKLLTRKSNHELLNSDCDRFVRAVKPGNNWVATASTYDVDNEKVLTSISNLITDRGIAEVSDLQAFAIQEAQKPHNRFNRKFNIYIDGEHNLNNIYQVLQNEHQVGYDEMSVYVGDTYIQVILSNRFTDETINDIIEDLPNATLVESSYVPFAEGSVPMNKTSNKRITTSVVTSEPLVNIKGESREMLQNALPLALQAAGASGVSGVEVEDDVVYLYWHKPAHCPSSINTLGYDTTEYYDIPFDEVVDEVWEQLGQLPDPGEGHGVDERYPTAEYSRGWRMYNNKGDFGYEHRMYRCLAIRPSIINIFD